MSITFNQFLSRIDEANIPGSRPRPRGNDRLTPEQRASIPTRRTTTPPPTTWRAPEYTKKIPNPQEPKKGGITFVDKGTQKPKPPKIELGLKKLGGGKETPVTFNRSMRKRGFVPIGSSGTEVKGAAYKSLVRGLRKQTQAEEFINLYQQSIID